MGIAFENAHLKLEIEETQKEMVYRLGDAVETRSHETGNHVKRVAEFSRLLGIGCDMGEAEVELLRLAAPLHDAGKIWIPDAILNKPGKLTPDEWRVMQTHAQQFEARSQFWIWSSLGLTDTFDLMKESVFHAGNKELVPCGIQGSEGCIGPRGP